MPDPRKPSRLGGIVHTYQKYDPGRFPSPTAPPPDLASAAFEHMLAFGSARRLTPEELADAVEIDPSQIAGLGPSIDSLIAMLEERKRKILETYETSAAIRDGDRAFRDEAARAEPHDADRDDFDRAVRTRQIRDLERLWYRQDDDHGEAGRAILRVRDRLGELVQIEQLDAKYTFTGRTPMSVPRAIEVKEELEAIDRLLEQLREARRNARVAVVDLDELRRFVDEADADQLEELGRRVADYIREQAELQGIESDRGGLKLTPKAMRLFQGKLLEIIFGELEAARSGRHSGPIVGEGAAELPRTRPYTFGDSAVHMDIPATLTNAVARSGAAAPGQRPRVSGEDIQIHDTRNNPKCATSVVMDMSGSMRYGGQYIDCKRMALALDGLIRTEYPGDFLSFVEMYSMARLCHVSELPELMPKPVTIRDPWVRLRANLSDPDVSESMLHPHFTNIQRALQLSRQVLAVQDTPNRQIILITDGLPTAHCEPEGDKTYLYLLYPPDPLTEEATLREARLCAREGITINIFLIPSWSQSSEDVAFAHRLAEETRGRVLFTGGADLDRAVLWDYVSGRRQTLG